MKSIFEKIWELALPYQDQRDDPGHAEITLKYAQELAKLEGGDEDVIIPAIILHDIGYSQIPKERRLLIFDKDASEEVKRGIALEHQNESVKLARGILRQVNYPEKLVPEILEIISQHDTRKGFISKNEGLVRDADKLWRTSPKGFAAMSNRRKSKDGPDLKKIEEGLSKQDYFYSDKARQMATVEFQTRVKKQESHSDLDR